MFQKYYSRFLSQLNGQLHFAAHSHHAWPDVSRDAQLRYWDDSSRFWDDKWELVFGEIIPKAQKHVAHILHLKNEKQIAFAPNTHELLVRLLSTFDPAKKPIRILSTNHEFHSFRRQMARLKEAGLVELTLLDSDELARNRRTFLHSVQRELVTGNYDLMFMSHVFFDSGIALQTSELQEICKLAPAQTIICIDGYHAFGAIPVDLSILEGRIFYLGGGYKYAQAGEGVCFVVVPQGKWRPLNTGWFADLGSLSAMIQSEVSYSDDGFAFWGSTFDPSGLYRFNSIWDLFDIERISIDQIHEHVKNLQDVFLNGISETLLKDYPILNQDLPRGHFITFELHSNSECEQMDLLLKNAGIKTDYRGKRLRFGFGMYHEVQDVMNLLNRLKSL